MPNEKLLKKASTFDIDEEMKDEEPKIKIEEEMKEESFKVGSINDIFFGESIDILYSINSEGEKKVLNKKRDRMSSIMLDLKHSNIYEAWD